MGRRGASLLGEVGARTRWAELTPTIIHPAPSFLPGDQAEQQKRIRGVLKRPWCEVPTEDESSGQALVAKFRSVLDAEQQKIDAAELETDGNDDGDDSAETEDGADEPPAEKQ